MSKFKVGDRVFRKGFFSSFEAYPIEIKEVYFTKKKKEPKYVSSGKNCRVYREKDLFSKEEILEEFKKFLTIK